MTAFHGFNVTAEFLVEVVGEDILAVDMEQLSTPLVPPCQGDDFGVMFKGGLPLSMPKRPPCLP